MSRSLRLIAALATLATVGCAAMTQSPPYVAPDAGSIATVRFKNESAKNLRLSVYAQPKDCAERRFAGVVGPNKEFAVRVRGDEALTFEYHLTTMGVTAGFVAEQYCVANLRFTPAGNGVFVFRTTDVNGRCEWVMTDGAGGGRVALTHLPWRQPFVDASPSCKESEAEADPGFSQLLVAR